MSTRRRVGSRRPILRKNTTLLVGLAVALGAIYAMSYVYVRSNCPMNLVQPLPEPSGGQAEEPGGEVQVGGYCANGDLGYFALQLVPLPFYCVGGGALFLAGRDYLKRLRRRADRKRKASMGMSESERRSARG